MKTFEEILKQFPPRYASQIVIEHRMSWWFMLQDGRLIGGAERVSHYEMMGIGPGSKIDHWVKKEFCTQNNVLRVSVTRRGAGEECATSEVNVEWFDEMVLTEEQISAIATLAKRTNDAEISWEKAAKDPTTGEYARTSGNGTIASFRRFLNGDRRQVKQ